MNLDELIDIVEPPPVPWTPQTVGWAILGTVLVLAAALALRGWLRRRGGRTADSSQCRALGRLCNGTYG